MDLLTHLRQNSKNDGPCMKLHIRGALESKVDKGHILINNLNFAPKLVSNERSILGVLLLIDVGFDFVIGEVDKYGFKVKSFVWPLRNFL